MRRLSYYTYVSINFKILIQRFTSEKKVNYKLVIIARNSTDEVTIATVRSSSASRYDNIPTAQMVIASHLIKYLAKLVLFCFKQLLLS